jgi:uncharacterized protein YbdZ (MbtH family)
MSIEEQRITAWAAGWNDAMTGKPARKEACLSYILGFMDARK